MRALVASLPGLVKKPTDAPLAQHLVAGARTIGRQGAQALLTLACLPYEALYSVDAAIRSMARLTVTHRRLLEWTAAADRAAGEVQVVHAAVAPIPRASR